MNKLRILIVEDGAEWVKMHRKLLDEIFTENPPQVDECYSARDGFTKALSASYDLIITDLEMERIPGESCAGAWFLKNITGREQFKDTKFLIISGAYNIMDIAMIYKTDHIPKSSLINNPLLLKYKLETLLE
ncbi:MAG: response regulator [Candidatus Gastranaerophilales bacterium]|nr:response regulator [Candidatus Gastranaerophilales bacterium]